MIQRKLLILFVSAALSLASTTTFARHGADDGANHEANEHVAGGTAATHDAREHVAGHEANEHATTGTGTAASNADSRGHRQERNRRGRHHDDTTPTTGGTATNTTTGTTSTNP
jgi:hypothetical protein